MHYFKHLNNNVLTFDLTNKFIYKDTKKLPKLKKIVLHLYNSTNNKNNLAKILLALKFISKKNGTFLYTKHTKISLKIKKGHPTYCKITLQKNFMNHFMDKLLKEVFPKIQSSASLQLQNNKKNSIFCKLGVLAFSKVEEYYSIFKNLTSLNIIFITNSKNNNELQMIIQTNQFSSLL